MHEFFKNFADATTIVVQVRPGARQTVLREIMEDGTLKIDLAATAEDNKANQELLRFLREDCEIPHVNIIRGKTHRRKTIRISKEI